MSGQNRSHAVMAQRHEPPDSLDYFPTPPWATRALCEWISGPGGVVFAAAAELARLSVFEPAAGEGHMARPLAEYFGRVEASDIHDHGAGYPVRDFLDAGTLFADAPPGAPFDWIVTNPPFRLGVEFALRARQMVRSTGGGVALLVRTGFLDGIERFRVLFSRHRPAVILQFSGRVPMIKGRLDKGASTATHYCWILWRSPGHIVTDTLFDWIEPDARARLERPGDYR